MISIDGTRGAMRALLLWGALLGASCAEGHAPRGVATPVAAAPPTTPFANPLRPCSPVTGLHTRDPALAVACDGCTQKYSSNMGLPDGVTFDRCVDESAVRVRAKLAIDPHHYDPVVRLLLGP